MSNIIEYYNNHDWTYDLIQQIKHNDQLRTDELIKRTAEVVNIVHPNNAKTNENSASQTQNVAQPAPPTQHHNFRNKCNMITMKQKTTAEIKDILKSYDNPNKYHRNDKSTAETYDTTNDHAAISAETSTLTINNIQTSAAETASNNDNKPFLKQQLESTKTITTPPQQHPSSYHMKKKQHKSKKKIHTLQSQFIIPSFSDQKNVMINTYGYHQ